MTYLKFCLRLILLVFLINYSAQGRWSKYEDAPVEITFYNNDISINQDGTSEEIMEIHAKILKESGRSQFSQYRLTYNNYSSKISILEAKTIYNGQEYVVSKDMIEDKPLASFGQGFDQRSGIATTNNKGEFYFITIYPSRVSRETPNVNIRVDHLYLGQLQTKLYLSNSRVNLENCGEVSHALSTALDGIKTYEFDVVMSGRTFKRY